mgnify:CR=1 FL=1
MARPRTKIALFLATLWLSALACNLPFGGVPTAPAPEVVWTYAAQTVVAQLTLNALGTLPVGTPIPSEIVPTAPVETVLPSPTETATPTDTPSPSPSPTMTPLPTFTPTSTPIPCDRASFVKDVTYPDNSQVPPGTEFIKTWRLKNTGSCTWNSAYSIVFERGDAMGGPASAPLTTGTVAPGQEVDVSIKLKAPDFPGTFQGYWKLRNPGGVVFGLGDKGDRSFWVKIQVSVPSGIGYDFIAQASSASWVSSGGGGEVSLSFGGAYDDPNGVARLDENLKLEDGSTAGKTLITLPKHNNDGTIAGTFSSYQVQYGDHFRARLGFLKDCDGGQVVFQLWYKQDGGLYLLKEWRKACDGKLLNVDVDLSDLRGKTVKFILKVLADGSPNNDFAIWASPRIER